MIRYDMKGRDGWMDGWIPVADVTSEMMVEGMDGARDGAGGRTDDIITPAGSGGISGGKGGKRGLYTYTTY